MPKHKIVVKRDDTRRCTFGDAPIGTIARYPGHLPVYIKNDRGEWTDLQKGITLVMDNVSKVTYCELLHENSEIIITVRNSEDGK